MRRKLKKESKVNGVNLDYGNFKSDANEGKMVKRSLLVMAKDLYLLYCALNDGDDLPQWCHYKIATTKKDLGDVCDYISSKIIQRHIDGETSTKDITCEVRNVLRKNVLKEKVINEFWNKKSKNNFREFYNIIRSIESNDMINFFNDLRVLSDNVYDAISLISRSRTSNYNNMTETSKKILYIKKILNIITNKIKSIENTVLEINSHSSSKFKSKRTVLDRIKSMFRESRELSYHAKNNLDSINVDGIYRSLRGFILKHKHFLESNSLKSVYDLKKAYKRLDKINSEDFYNSLIIYLTNYVTPEYEKVSSMFKMIEKDIMISFEKRKGFDSAHTIPKPLDPDFNLENIEKRRHE